MGADKVEDYAMKMYGDIEIFLRAFWIFGNRRR
jgi:hypothetical protein